MEPAAHGTRGQKRKASPPRPKDAGFTIVPRPDANNPVVLHLQQIDAYIRSAQGKRHIDQMLDNGVEGIRFIQKKRIEVFVQAEGKSSVAMDQILQAALPHDPQEPNDDNDAERVRAMIVQYVEQQADSQQDYILGNFSLIINLNKVEAQYPHVDLWHPNIQYGLALTDHCPATMVFATEPSITTARDFQTVACPDLPEALVALLDEKCHGLFQNFGNVLHPKPIRIQNEQSDTHGCSLRTGDVTILKGGRVHAGPAWDQPRVILFASGCPKKNKSDHDDDVDGKSQVVEPYDPDVQYTRAQLMATILSAVFADLEQGHRVFLLTELAKMMKEASTKNLSLHLHDPVMIEFTSLVEKYESPRKKYPQGGKAAFIERFAREADLKLVSVPGLQTDHWKDQEEDEDGASAKMMEVYRSFDPNLAWVRYATTAPDEQQQDEQHQPLEWTWDLDRLYTLQMTNSSTKKGDDGGGLNRPLFDGQKENGILMDEKGTVMNCYVRVE